MTTHVPTGWWLRFLGWIRDFVAMPKRIAELRASRHEVESRAKDCPSCGLRMRLFHTIADPKGFDRWQYECDTCKIAPWYTFKP